MAASDWEVVDDTGQKDVWEVVQEDVAPVDEGDWEVVTQPTAPDVSVGRQVEFGFASSSNDVTDLADLATARTGIGGRFGIKDGEFFYNSAEDQFGSDWNDLDYEGRRARIKEVRDAEIAAEYGDVIKAEKTDSGWAALGGIGKVVATPTSLIPVGTSAKVANNLYKLGKVGATGQKWVAAAETTGKLAMVNVAFATESSVLRQLAAEGTVDYKQTAEEAAFAAAFAPALVVGAKVAGVAGRKIFKDPNASVDSMTKGQARAKYRQIEQDMVDIQVKADSAKNTEVGSVERFKEAGKTIYKQYEDIYAQREAFLKKAGYNEMPMPGRDSAKRIDVYDNQGPGAGNWARLTQWLDWAGGAVDTRIRNISQSVAGRLHQTDLAVLERTKDAEVMVDTMRKGVDALDDSKLVWRLYQNQSWDEAATYLKTIGKDDVAKAAEDVRVLLKELGDESVSLGIIKKEGKGGFIKDYFPRHIKDEAGMRKKLGVEMTSAMDDALAKANAVAKKQGRTKSASSWMPGKPANYLTNYERSVVMNRALRDFNPKKYPGKKGFTNERRMKDGIPDFLLPFYHEPQNSLHLYMRDAIDEIEARKFFGVTSKEKKLPPKELKVWNRKNKNKQTVGKFVKSRKKTGKQEDLLTQKQKEFIVEDSVGSIVNREGGLNTAQRGELTSLLTSRFGPGRRQSAPYISNLKSFTYGALIGNIHSAVQQFGDAGVSMWVNGIGNTTRTVFNRAGRALTRKEQLVDVAADAGIARIAHDIANGGVHSQLTRVMKYSGFSKVDVMMKNITAEASLRKAWKQAGTKQGRADIYSRYAPAWGIEDTVKLIDDLKASKNGAPPSDLMKSYAANEILGMQPIAKSALPQAYLDHPDGRIAYTLLTWSLRLIDLGRRRIYNTYRSGNKARAMIELGRAAAILGTMETGIDYVQDFMRGKDVRAEDFPLRVGLNLMKMSAGVNKYDLNQFDSEPLTALTAGFTGVPTRGVVNDIVAPFTTMATGVEGASGREWGGEQYKKEVGDAFMKASRFFPVVGPYIKPASEWAWGSGKWEDKKYNEQQRKKRGETGGLSTLITNGSSSPSLPSLKFKGN